MLPHVFNCLLSLYMNITTFLSHGYIPYILALGTNAISNDGDVTLKHCHANIFPGYLNGHTNLNYFLFSYK